MKVNIFPGVWGSNFGAVSSIISVGYTCSMSRFFPSVTGTFLKASIIEAPVAVLSPFRFPFFNDCGGTEDTVLRLAAFTAALSAVCTSFKLFSLEGAAAVFEHSSEFRKYGLFTGRSLL